MKKKILLVIIALVMFSLTAFSQEEIVELVDTYTAHDIYNKAVELSEMYPEIINIEILGYSQGGEPIFVMHITENPESVSKDKRVSVNKMNFFVEGGIHSRENVSPVMLLKIIETYAKDYRDDSVLPLFSLKTYLASNVIHVLPLTNPDGYNLANFGLTVLNEASQKKVKEINLRPFNDLKSNLSGVDLNRNFPGIYFNIASNRFEDIWQIRVDDFVSDEPSGAYFAGGTPGSEIETRILMHYIQKYDFRNYLSFHSRGEVIYYYKWMLSETHNKHSIDLARAISENNGNQYRVYLGDEDESSSGYLTDYAAMITLKPSLTVESVPGRADLPAKISLIEEAYVDNLYVILQSMDNGRAVGYFPYHLYVNNKYVRDYEEKPYAEAMAAYLGGVIYESNQNPVLQIPKAHHYLTRLELLQYVMVTMDFQPVVLTTNFADTENFFASQAKSMGLVVGSNNLFRPNDTAKAEEAYVLMEKAFLGDEKIQTEILYPYNIPWAEKSVNRLIAKDKLPIEWLRTGPISLEHLEEMLKQFK